MSTQASSSSAPPPLPLGGPSTAPPSVSPTLPSSTSSQSHPSPPMASPSNHSPETRRQIAEARAALEASMSNIGSSLDHTLRSRAENLHANSKQLEKQQKDVVKATEGLKKENQKLSKLADEGSKKLKELGNVQNWAEMLERDFVVLGETLRLANLPSDEEWESTDGEESMSESDDEERMKRFVYGEHKFIPEESPAIDSPAIESPAVDSPRAMDVDGDTMMAMDDVDGGGIPDLGQEHKAALEQVPQQTVGDSMEHDGKVEDTVKEDKGKGKAIEIQDSASIEHTTMENHDANDTTMENTTMEQGGSEQEQEVVGGSGTATSGSASDPSSTSVHTAASAAS